MSMKFFTIGGWFDCKMVSTNKYIQSCQHFDEAAHKLTSYDL